MEKRLTPSQKKARAAGRAREYRQRQRDAARPAARVVDQAISEAVAFRFWQAGGYLVPRGSVHLDVSKIQITATACLTREGYDKAKSAAAVIDRLRCRPEHKQSDYIPALKPHPDPSARIPDRIAPRGPRPDCRPPVPAAEPVDLAAQRTADLEWFFDGISEPAE